MCKIFVYYLSIPQVQNLVSPPDLYRNMKTKVKMLKWFKENFFIPASLMKFQEKSLPFEIIALNTSLSFFKYFTNIDRYTRTYKITANYFFYAV